MKNPITKEIINHLEYLGYKIKDISEGEENDVFVGESEQKSNILVQILKDNTILVIAKYKIFKSINDIKEDFLVELNRLNSRFIYTKVYYQENKDSGVDLAIETFTIDYDKVGFLTVMEALERDVSAYLLGLKEFISE